MNKSFLNLAIIAGLGISGQTFAHEGGTVNEAFVGDSKSHMVTDSSGDCVRTSSWSEDKAVVGCGLQPAPEPVAEVAPAPAPKVVSHARRYFFDALSSDRTRATEMLDKIRRLYAVEEAAKGLAEPERKLERLRRSTRILQEIAS